MTWAAALFLVVMASQSWALGGAYGTAFKQQLQNIIDRHPRYTWGGSTSEAEGLDCSGFIYLAGKRAGLPVGRTTSNHISMGDSGWCGRDIVLDAAKELDLIFWTWRDKPTRVNGHVGALWRTRGGFPAVTHSSESRGVVVDDIKGALLRDLSRVRRLTIGDQK